MSFRTRWAGWVFDGRPPPMKVARIWWQYAYLVPGAMVAVAVWMALSSPSYSLPFSGLALAAGFAWGFPVYFLGGTIGLAANTRGFPLRYLGAIAALGFCQIPVMAVLFRIFVQSPSTWSPTWISNGFLLGVAMASALLGVWVRGLSGDAGKTASLTS